MTPPGDTVLLVEDAKDLGPLLQETLEEWNHRALLARTAAEAMEVLAREPVALMLLDHELPDMSAPELLAALRSEHRLIPRVVLVTGRRTRSGCPSWSRCSASRSTSPTSARS